MPRTRSRLALSVGLECCSECMLAYGCASSVEYFCIFIYLQYLLLLVYLFAMSMIYEHECI